MAFNIPSQWGAGQANPTTAPLTWTRPADWPVITDTANEVQLLVSDAALLVYALKTSFTRPASENLYIDWGDGTVDTVTTNTDTWTSHTYVAGTGTACSRGYTTWKVRVYTDAGCVINNAVIDSNSGAAMPYAANVIQNTTGALEIYYGNGTQPADISVQVSNRGCFFSYLEYVKYPTDMSYSAFSWNNAFNNSTTANNPNLSKVVMPVTLGTVNNITFNNAFNSCYNLLELTFPATAITTNLDTTFFNCRNLQSVTFSTNATAYDTLTTTANMFSGCSLLTTLVNFPTALPAITNLTSMFADCRSLNNITIPRLGTTAGGTITVTSMFNNCFSLRSVLWAGDYTAGTPIILTATSTFSTCTNLMFLRFPEGLSVGNINQTFSSCGSLKSVIFPNSSVDLSGASSTFTNCYTLQQVVFPATVTSVLALVTTFDGCGSIESITLPEGGTISSLSTTFRNCFNLKSITLPTSLANCTTLASTFSNCVSLQQVTFPANMPLVGSLNFTFAGCTSLHTVTMPTTLTALTTLASAFSGCTSLSGTITFPALPALTTVASAFFTCRSLKSVVFSTVNAAITTWANAFQSCTSLENVTLPSTQMTGMTTTASISNVFRDCPSLETVTNMDKLGATTNTAFFDASNTTNNTFTGAYYLSAISLSPRISRFTCNGTATTPIKLNSVRLFATAAGQYTGVSPQINVSYTSLGTAALDQLFTDLPTVTSRTIDITGTPGAATCTRSIATAKGWIVTG